MALQSNVVPSHKFNTFKTKFFKMFIGPRTLDAAKGLIFLTHSFAKKYNMISTFIRFVTLSLFKY